MSYKIQALLLGGPGCGKTALLASMFDQLARDEINRYLTVFDQTIMSDDITSLCSKHFEVLDCLAEHNVSRSSFSQGIHYSSLYPATYSFRLRPQNTWNCDLNVDFFEVPGTMLMSVIHREEFCGLMKQRDAVVIVVDTPFLMEAPVAVNQYQNRIPEILNLLGREDLNGKMVMLVPVKCEKWAKEGRIDEVIEEVKSAYQPLISMLLDYSNINVCILPAETTGGIHFFEFRDAFIIHTQKGKTLPCCKLSETLVRIFDGSVYELGEGDIIERDPESEISGTGLLKPYAWYRVDRNEYAPKNCEQLLLHILSYMVHSATWKAAKLPFFPVGALFGPTLTTWANLLLYIEEAGLIKDGAEGIEYLKKDF